MILKDLLRNLRLKLKTQMENSFTMAKYFAQTMMCFVAKECVYGSRAEAWRSSSAGFAIMSSRASVVTSSRRTCNTMTENFSSSSIMEKVQSITATGESTRATLLTVRNTGMACAVSQMARSTLANGRTARWTVRERWSTRSSSTRGLAHGKSGGSTESTL